MAVEAQDRDQLSSIGFTGGPSGPSGRRRRSRHVRRRQDSRWAVRTRLARVDRFVKIGFLRMFMSGREWWAALFVGFSAMGWIFNAFGAALVIFSYNAGLAWAFFMVGCGFWILGGAILTYFSVKPLPAGAPPR